MAFRQPVHDNTRTLHEHHELHRGARTEPTVAHHQLERRPRKRVAFGPRIRFWSGNRTSIIGHKVFCAENRRSGWVRRSIRVLIQTLQHADDLFERDMRHDHHALGPFALEIPRAAFKPGVDGMRQSEEIRRIALIQPLCGSPVFEIGITSGFDVSHRLNAHECAS